MWWIALMLNALAAAPAAPPSKPCGVEQAGVRLCIDAPTWVRAGEPIVLSFEVSNLTQAPLWVPAWMGPDDGVGVVVDDGARKLFNFTLHRQDGGEVLPVPAGHGEGAERVRLLGPGEQRRESSTITESYQLTEPGTYVMKVVYSSAPWIEHPNEWQGLIRYPDIKVIVLPARPPSHGHDPQRAAAGRRAALEKPRRP